MEEQETWIEQLNRKQIDGFHHLFRSFYRYLVVYAMKWVEVQEVAEDIVQDLFIQIWERDTTYSSYYGFKNFVYQSVKHASLDYLKHQKVEKKYIHYILQHHEEGEMPEPEIMKNEVYRKLYLVMEELPKRCREVFEYHLQGKKNAEIASLLQISELTVKVQKRNALKHISARLKNTLPILLIFKILHSLD